jgi:hypothetical protein
VTARVTAFSVPISTGVNWHFTDVVAAGIGITVSPWAPYEICQSVAPNGDLLCTSNNLGGNVFLSATANLRVQLPY